MSCLTNYLKYDDRRIVKNKACPAGNIRILARDTTRLLAILSHPEGAFHGPSAVVAVLVKGPDPVDQDPTLFVEPRLATEPVERIILQVISRAGH